MYVYSSVCFAFLQTNISYTAVCKLKDVYVIHSMATFLATAGAPLWTRYSDMKWAAKAVYTFMLPETALKLIYCHI